MESDSQETNRFKFTKRGIENLQRPSEKVTYYYDTATRGLALSIGISGRKSFFLYRKVAGKPTRIKIGPFPDLSVEQARTRADELNGRISSGALTAHRIVQGAPISNNNQNASATTFREMFAVYLRDHAQHKKLTWKEDEAIFERNFTGKRSTEGVAWPDISRMPFQEVTGPVLRQLHTLMRTTPVAANRTLALASSVFTFAIRDDKFTGGNPCAAVKKYTEIDRERFLQPDEAPMLWDSLRYCRGDDSADFVMLMLFTGSRRGKILSMRWDDVSLERGQWLLRRTKNGVSQVIPLVSEALEILKARKVAQLKNDRRSSYVFPGRGVKKHLVEPKRGWSTVCQRATAFRLIDSLKKIEALDANDLSLAFEEAKTYPAKVIKRLEPLATEAMIEPSAYDMTDLHMHDMRRTVGSWLASKGTSLPLIGRILNHKSAQSTEVYARFYLEPVQEALSIFAAQLVAKRSNP